MNRLVKIITDDDGTACDPCWHVVHGFGESDTVLCDGQAFGLGESAAVYKEKTAERGITCPSCRQHIKEMKAIKL